jgi:N-acetylglucosaminyl-diphospho-decaprenol L-rhamnosyltransferase
VGELLLVENPGGSPAAPGRTRVLKNDRTLGFGANINKGVSATKAPYVVASNADIEATPGSIAALAEFADAQPRCGIAGPQMRYPDDRWQPSRRSFPTVSGTLVRRTPLRRALHPETRQTRHYLLDERPTEPIHADWLLGAFLFLRRAMLDELGGMDEGYRLYGDDIDLAYRARKAGWERWYVPDAVVVHHHQAVTDRRFFTRRTLWHWRSMLRFVRKHPESLRQL